MIAPRDTYIYRLSGQSGCVYVGMTSDPKRRLAAHARADWFDDALTVRLKGPTRSMSMSETTTAYAARVNSGDDTKSAA